MNAVAYRPGQVGRSRNMGWFSKKPSWEMSYAHTIYDGLVVHNNFGNITALNSEFRLLRTRPTKTKYFYSAR